MRVFPAEERSLEGALGLGPLLLAHAAGEGRAQLAASVVGGPAVVLGARQRAGRVVDLEACAASGTRVVPRTSTGTAAYLGTTGIVWTLALPAVASLFPDASPRTLLNRNVRPFLEGLRAAGVTARYFGREWIAAGRRPVALLGFEVTEAGAVLLEVLAGHEQGVGLPAGLAAPAEREIDRWRGHEPIPLVEALARPSSALAIARTVGDAVAARSTVTLETSPGEGPSPPRAEPAAGRAQSLDDGAGGALLGAAEPAPEGFVVRPSRRVAVGWLDAALDPATRAVWLGGDVLAGGYALAAVGAEPASASRGLLGRVALEGATLDDLVEAVEAARALTD